MVTTFGNYFKQKCKQGCRVLGRSVKKSSLWGLLLLLTLTACGGGGADNGSGKEAAAVVVSVSPNVTTTVDVPENDSNPPATPVVTPIPVVPPPPVVVTPPSNHAPTIAGNPASNVDAFGTYRFTPTVRDVEGDKLTFTVANLPKWLTFDEATGTLSGWAVTVYGYLFENIIISVSDGKTTVSLPAFSIRINEPVSYDPPLVTPPTPPPPAANRAPVISGVAATTVYVGRDTYEFTPTASDPDNDPLTFSVTNLPVWARFDPATGKLSGTPTEANEGTSNNIVINVSDGKGGTASLAAFNLTVIVTHANREPTISGTPASSVNVGVAYSFTPTASDADNDRLTFSISNKPAWATFDPATGQLSGTPSDTHVGASSNISISVSDGVAEAVSLQPFEIQVVSLNHVPAISGLPATSIDVGSAYGFTPTADDADGDSVTFSIANQPGWATFDPATGRLSGTPAVGDVGITSDIVITASDGHGGNTSLPAFSIQVNQQANHIPVIGGTASPTAYVGVIYRFTPTTSDADNDRLTFSIANKPVWASFDPVTGTLSGTPTATGTFADITISTTDGKSPAVSLPAAFSIVVEAPINLARQFGTATQGSTGWGGLAAHAIDGRTDNFNHTECDAQTNWWQVSLPNPTQVEKIVVKNRASNQSRLNGAAVYVTNVPYTAIPADADKVGTLTGTSADQVLTLATPKQGAYVIVKGAGASCLHMAEVEVYGQAPAAPVFTQTNADFLLSHSAAIGSAVGTLSAVDYQRDSLTYTLAGADAAPFAIDGQGNITVNAALTAGATYTFDVVVSDGGQTTRKPVTVRVSSNTAVQDAISNGNASAVTVDELLAAGIAVAQTESDYCKAELAKVYPAGLKQTTFPTRSAYMASTSSRNIPLHVSSSNGDTRVYSWMGSKASGTRYAVLGTNVFTFDTVNTDLKDNTLNLLRWLLQRSAGADILNENLRILVPDYWDRAALNDWFSDNGLTHHWTILTDTALLDTGAFDLYLADIGRSLTEKQKAFAAGKPVLVFNNWYEPRAADLAEFDLAWRWYGSQTIGSLAAVEAQCAQSSSANVIQTLLTSLQAGMPSFNYESSDCPNNVGTVSCDLTKVTDGTGKSVQDLFNAGASAIRTQLRALDQAGTNLFALDDSKNLLKIAVLLADKYRENIQYTMDKDTTDDTRFYQALFADYAVHYARPNNAYQPDMGDFTDAVVALNAAPTTTATQSFTPTAFTEWTSTGLYAPPGKTITIRRTDSSTNKVRMKLNFLRESTRLWNTDQYSRPRYMSSPEVTLAAGETYTLSTPYGGPIYIAWDGVASGAVPFTVEFQNVLDNPLLTAFDSVSIQTFLSEVEAANSDWVDIKTPFAEIHSLKSHMLKAFAKQDGDEADGYTPADVEGYIRELNKYLIAGNYEYTGFTGTGTDLQALNPDVSAFCSRTGFDLTTVVYGNSPTAMDLCRDAVINARPKIQHINSDVNAACGGLCSGNPFDSSAPIMPVDWGENHEMGHNLQRGRTKIYDGRSTEVSNNIYPMHTQWQWAKDHSLIKHPTQTRPANEEAFRLLQTAIAAGTAPSINHPLWTQSGTYDKAFERLSFYIQLVYTQGSWDLYTKLHIMERIFSDAIKDDDKWLDVRALLGFGSYNRTEASAISSNDFMYIATSMIGGKNYSDYFEVWGIQLSQKAKDQVTANGITTQQPKVFYYVNDELPVAMPTDTIPLNGTSAWADPTP